MITSEQLEQLGAVRLGVILRAHDKLAVPGKINKKYLYKKTGGMNMKKKLRKNLFDLFVVLLNMAEERPAVKYIGYFPNKGEIDINLCDGDGDEVIVVENFKNKSFLEVVNTVTASLIEWRKKQTPDAGKAE